MPESEGFQQPIEVGHASCAAMVSGADDVMAVFAGGVILVRRCLCVAAEADSLGPSYTDRVNLTMKTGLHRDDRIRSSHVTVGSQGFW
jgi:hypothetical protein